MPDVAADLLDDRCDHGQFGHDTDTVVKSHDLGRDHGSESELSPDAIFHFRTQSAIDPDGAAELHHFSGISGRTERSERAHEHIVPVQALDPERDRLRMLTMGAADHDLSAMLLRPIVH